MTPTPMRTHLIYILVLVVALVSAAVLVRSAKADAAEAAARLLDTQQQLAAETAKARTAVATSGRLAQTAATSAQIRTIEKVITREVPVRIPVGSVYLPDDFSLLHDAAASSAVPPPASQLDGPGSDLAVATGVIASNYASCNIVREQLHSIQDWVCTVTAGTPSESGCSYSSAGPSE